MTSLRNRLPAGTILLFSLFVLGLVIALKVWSPPKSSLDAGELVGVMRPEPRTIEGILLRDQGGMTFTKERLLGKWTFLFFGYTRCPDVCPATLSILAKVKSRVEQEKPTVPLQFVFVTVDPGRDNLEKLGAYVEYFDPEFLGLEGSKEQIDEFIHQVGGAYLLEGDASADEYLVNHTSAVFLVDPEARAIATFSQPHDAETIVYQFYKILSYY